MSLAKMWVPNEILVSGHSHVYVDVTGAFKPIENEWQFASSVVAR